MSELLPPGLDLGGRRVLVLGLGITGRDVAMLLADRGASVLASEAGDVAAADRASLETAGIDVESGGHVRAKDFLRGCDFVVPSPGISPFGTFLTDVVASGVPIVSELDLGARLTDAPVVAVTGTNGKTTVCRLAERIGREAGLEVYACGNLEEKFATAAGRRPDADAFVVEASSFALAFCEHFAPRVAVITNLAVAHLDWHETFEHYRDSKARIAARQSEDDLFLYPASQSDLAGLAPSNGPRRAVFATSAPKEGHGTWTEGAEVVVRMFGTELRARGADVLAARGPHFAEDAAAAAGAMSYLGVGADAIERALTSFSFDHHRLEPVGRANGVLVVDDSKATNPHATVAALRSFPASQQIVLIAGGIDRGVDLTPLVAEADRLRAVVALGQTAGQLVRVFASTSVRVRSVGSMAEAVGVALEEAEDGDVILLSPACASLDMYASYADRGVAFRQACLAHGVVA